MGKVWELAAKGRNDFADMIESLDSTQLGVETLCAGWTPKHVLAHLVRFVDQSLPKFFFGIARHKFDFDAASIASADNYVGNFSVAEMIVTLRSKATKPAPLPTFPESLTLADVAVHTQDVRRALELDGQLDDDVLRGALDFVTGDKKAQQIFKVPNLDGLSFEATDSDFSAGSGASITGSGEAFLMALLRRPTLDELSGDGVAQLRGLLRDH